MRALVLSLAVLASCAAPAKSVPPEESSRFDTRISLQLQRASLDEALDLIAKKSGLNIIVQSGLPGTVTMSVNDLPAGEVLDAVAKNFGLKAVRILRSNTARITS